MTKVQCLEATIKITEEYARGGGNYTPDQILQLTYDKLKALSEDLGT